MTAAELDVYINDMQRALAYVERSTAMPGVEHQWGLCVCVCVNQIFH
jgi:hypothetical protein